MKTWHACTRFDLSEFTSAPERDTVRQELNCTPERLFDIFEDPHSWTQWATGLDHVEWTSPKPFGVGTTRIVTFVGGMQIWEEFIAWERGRRLSFIVPRATKTTFERFGEDYYVEPLGAERCRLTWTLAFNLNGPAKYLQAASRPLRSVAMRKMFRDLAGYVDSMQ